MKKPKIYTYKEAIKKVFVIEETRDYSLERVKKAMKLLKYPLKNIKIIHIAGTNWKWSVSKMCFSVLKHAWKKVGAFTQPHLLNITERFITEQWEITEDEFVEFLNIILDLGLNFSFFEKAFLISCLLFEKREVEFGIMEVWFGWLLDSTNVVEPLITAITSIWIDHTKILWNTLEEISFQKAGIIKYGIPIVYNHKNDIIQNIAQKKQSPIIFTQKKIATNLIWNYQQKNAWIAFEICTYINIKKSLILEWLQKVQHWWRLQYITPNVLIDWAHNEQWLHELNKYLQSIVENKYYQNIQLCIAQKKRKDWSEIMKVFWEHFQKIILVESKNTLMVEKAELLQEKIIALDSLFQKQTFEILSPKEIYTLSQKNSNILYVAFWSLYMIWDFLQFTSQ